MNEQLLYIAFIIAGVLVTAASIRLWKKPNIGTSAPNSSSVVRPEEPMLPPAVQSLEEQVQWLKPKGSK